MLPPHSLAMLWIWGRLNSTQLHMSLERFAELGQLAVNARWLILLACSTWPRSVCAQVPDDAPPLAHAAQAVNCRTSTGAALCATPSSPPTSRPVIELRVVGRERALDALREALSENRLGNAELQWSYTNRFAPQELLSLVPAAKVRLHCWIDLTDPVTAQLYFVAPAHDRFMLRDFALANRLGSFELESLAQIVELSVQALLTDAAAGMSRREAVEILSPERKRKPTLALTHAANAPKRTLAPLAREDLRFGVTATYSFTQFSRELFLQHGPGVTLSLHRTSSSARSEFGLVLAYYLPSRLYNNVAGAELDRTELGLEASRQWPLFGSTKHFLGPELQTGLGVLSVRSLPGNLTGAYSMNKNARELEGYLGVGIRLTSQFTPHLGSALLVGARLQPVPVRYAYVVDGATEQLTEGRHVRFGVSLGLLVD